MATIEIDAADHLHELATEALERELLRRCGDGVSLYSPQCWSNGALRYELARRQGLASGDLHFWDADGLAQDLRGAYYARNASRFELLLTVLVSFCHQADWREV